MQQLPSELQKNAIDLSHFGRTSRFQLLATRVRKLHPKLFIPLIAFAVFMLPLTLRSVSKPTQTSSEASQGVHVPGRIFYLSPTGTANTTCDVSQPCGDIATVLQLPSLGEQAGDTVILRDGVYVGQQRVVNKHFAYPVQIQAEHPYKAVLQNNGVVLNLRNAYNLVFQGLELKQVEPIPTCNTTNESAYIIQLSDSSDPNGPFGAKRGPDSVYYDANGKLYPNGTDFTGEITFENNIIHDSFCEDHIKLQNGGNINIVGNMFYNQATRNNAAGTVANTGTPDEFIDVNSVFNVRISQNLFFNDFAHPAETGAFIVVKDSGMGVPDGNTRFGLTDQTGQVVAPYPNGNTFAVNPDPNSPGTRLNTCNPAGSNCDTVIGSNSIQIDRNIFFNFKNTSTQYPWLQFGAEDTLMYVLNHGIVENNLFIGNSSAITRAVFELEGVRNFQFRNNTITGSLPSKHYGYRLKSQDFAYRFPNTAVTIANNIWADQTGTMGTEDSTVPFFARAETTTVTPQRLLANNLYWNNGQPIPNTLNFVAQYTEDVAPVLLDPGLPNPAQLQTPLWDGATFRAVVAGQAPATNIAAVFENLVRNFGTPTVGVTDKANQTYASPVDIRGAQRGPSPDIGAVELSPFAPPSPTPMASPIPSPSIIPTPRSTPLSSPTVPTSTPTSFQELKVNFQPADAAIPTGYIADTGERFGERNGLQYGWSYDIHTATRKRNSAESQLRDTLIHMQLNGNYRWDVVVPNGQYEVTIMAGDPSFTDSLNSLRVESTVLEDDSRDNFDYYTTTVSVTDGRLTIRTASTAQNAKLNYVVIRKL